MKKTLALILAGIQLASCSSPGSSAVKLNQVTSICAFPEIATRSVGERIRIRGKMTLHAHGVLLTDEQCPEMQVHLKSTNGGPDISLCSSPELVNRFGCPAGGDSGPLATAIGTLSKVTEPKVGVLLVEELIDFENAIHAGRN
jgi:hypothetical protein